MCSTKSAQVVFSHRKLLNLETLLSKIERDYSYIEMFFILAVVMQVLSRDEQPEPEPTRRRSIGTFLFYFIFILFNTIISGESPN